MEYDISRLQSDEDSKNKISHTNEWTYFQICIDWIVVYNYIFLKVIFLLCSNMFCEICSIASCFAGLKCFSVSLALMYYFHILCNTMDSYKCKLNLTWSCKLLICKRITEYICWGVGVQLTHHIKVCTRNISTPK